MRRPIFPGNTDTDQLDKIWGVCGSPNQQNWPDYDKLPNCGGQTRFRPQERRVKAVYESYVDNLFLQLFLICLSLEVLGKRPALS